MIRTKLLTYKNIRKFKNRTKVSESVIPGLISDKSKGLINLYFSCFRSFLFGAVLVSLRSLSLNRYLDTYIYKYLQT